MDYSETKGLCRRGEKSYGKAIKLTTEAVKATLSQRLTAESVVMGYVEEISPETKNIILDHICFDLDASVEHIKKNMPRILAENLRRENELTERMKGYWIFKERD